MSPGTEASARTESQNHRITESERTTIPDLHQLKVPSFGCSSDVSPQPSVWPWELLCAFI